MSKIRCLSGNTLKLIAAMAMAIDHIGLIFFPFRPIYRIIGRLAFPIFAFMIAEGCRYTRNKLRYFLTMAGLAAVFQAVYFILFQSLDMCIFVTFSFSILIIYSLQCFKRAFLSPTASRKDKLLSLSLLVGLTVGVFVLDIFIYMDYDFAGCMLPVLISLPHSEEGSPERARQLDNHYASIAMTAIGLVLLALVNKPIQMYSFLTLPLLLLYSGKRGRLKLKYFFYIFYPAHLVILYGIDMLMR